MSEAPEPIIEEEPKNTIEQATQETQPINNDVITEENIKNEVKQEENANEETQFKNKTDRMKNKKINCKDCGANLTLKTLRYSHKCSKLEDKPITPKPKAKTKVKAVPIQPIQTQNEVIQEPSTTVKEVKPRIIQEPQQPVIIRTPQQQMMDNYNLMHQEYLNKKKEKVNNLCMNMFSGNLRTKKR